MLPLLVLLGTISGAWYLLIVRPQREQGTRHVRLVERLQVGDHVLTVGGIYGRVATVEGSSVLLELAPGTTSRIATDGIARIVQAAEAGLQLAPTDSAGSDQTTAMTPRQAMDDNMHQPHQPQPQPAMPAYAAPPAPTFAQPVYAQPGGDGTTTLRAQVLPGAVPMQPTYAAAPTHAPAPTYPPSSPWADVAPVTHAAAPAPAPARPTSGFMLPPPPQLVVQTPFTPQPVAAPAQPHHAPGGFAPLGYAQPQAPTGYPAVAPQPMPTHPAAYAAPMAAPAPAPAHAPAHAPVAYAPGLAAYAPAPAAAPGYAPGYAPGSAPAPVQPTLVPPVEEVAPGSARKHSRAPQGMGSTLRLDDPSLTDTMVRARGERAGLAEEYRRLTAPMVDSGQAQVVEPQVQYAPAPQGAPGAGLFVVGQGGQPAPAPAHMYPGPARVPQHEGAHGQMPRPYVETPATIDPAFQRRTPMTQAPGVAPVQPGTVVAPPAGMPAHA